MQEADLLDRPRQRVSPQGRDRGDRDTRNAGRRPRHRDPPRDRDSPSALIIAYLLPRLRLRGGRRSASASGPTDLAQHGPFGFYDRGFFADYTPGYLYVLWLGRASSAARSAASATSSSCPRSSPTASWRTSSGRWCARSAAGSARRSSGPPSSSSTPITWFDSAVWGQVDSVGDVFLLLGLRALWRGQSVRAAILAVLAAIIKPQFGILLPIVAVVLLRRHLRTHGHGERPIGLVWAAPIRRRSGDRPSSSRSRSPSGRADLLYKVCGQTVTPRRLRVPDGQRVQPVGAHPARRQRPRRDGHVGPRRSGGTRARRPLVRAASRVMVGTGLLLAGDRASSLVVSRRDDRRTILVGLTVMAIAFFVVPTRVHERYLFPFFAFGAILAATSNKWRVAYAVLAAASFVNLYAILTLPFYDNPGISDWLGVGPFIRSFAGVAVVAFAHLAVFLWSLTRLHRAARSRRTTRRPDARRSRTARPAAAAGRRRPPDGCRPEGRPRPAPPPRPRGDRRGGGRCGERGRGRRPRRRLVARRLAPAARVVPRPATGRRRSGPRSAGGSTGWTSGSSSSSSSCRRSACGRSGSPSRTGCTSTRSTTRGPRRSSSSSGGTASRTTSTSTRTRTSRSTRWRAGSWSFGDDRGHVHERRSASR